MTSALVEVRSLRKCFGAVVAVDDVSFSVRRGEVLGVLGPNGAGKSTTMKVIAGILAPTWGAALVDGEDVRSNPLACKRKLGYLPEGSPLYGDMTPEGFLDFVGRTRLMSPKTRKKAVADVIGRLELWPMRYRRIETLSKGYRRRVGVAQAIMHDPDILVLDEPTDGLDPNQKHQVRQLIRSMGGNKAIVISTHLLEEVEAVCDRIIIIKHGRVVIDATPEQLYVQSPDYNAVSLTLSDSDASRVAALLQAIPQIAVVELVGSRHGATTLRVRPRQGRFIADLVADCMRKNGVSATEMHGAITRLDDVFRSITAAQGSN